MSRHQCSVYVNNIDNRTTEEHLVAYFSKFGSIESYTYMPRSCRRSTTAAIFTYFTLKDVDRIFEHGSRHSLNGHAMLIRRTLPCNRPDFERFIQTNTLLLSLEHACDDENFNSVTIRKYFSDYGSIVSCRPVIARTAFLLDFAEIDSADRAILAEPHFYNENKLTLRKYVGPDRVTLYLTRGYSPKHGRVQMRYYLLEQIRRLKHTSEALKFGQQVQLDLIKYSLDEQKLKGVRERYDKTKSALLQLEEAQADIRASMEQMKAESERLRTSIEQNRQVGEKLLESYEKKIDAENRRAIELTEALELLNDYVE